MHTVVKCAACDDVEVLIIEQDILAGIQPGFRLEWVCSHCKHSNASKISDIEVQNVHNNYVPVDIAPPPYEEPEPELPAYMNNPLENAMSKKEVVMTVVYCGACTSKNEHAIHQGDLEDVWRRKTGFEWKCSVCGVTNLYKFEPNGSARSHVVLSIDRSVDVKRERKEEVKEDAEPPAAKPKVTFSDICVPNSMFLTSLAWGDIGAPSKERDYWSVFYCIVTVLVMPIAFAGDLVSPILAVFIFPFIYMFGCCCKVSKMTCWGAALSFPRLLFYLLYASVYYSVLFVVLLTVSLVFIPLSLLLACLVKDAKSSGVRAH
jgi:hypothetical protein